MPKRNKRMFVSNVRKCVWVRVLDLIRKANTLNFNQRKTRNKTVFSSFQAHTHVHAPLSHDNFDCLHSLRSPHVLHTFYQAVVYVCMCVCVRKHIVCSVKIGRLKSFSMRSGKT